ncbi:hypothetical protein [Cupriavidus taiwanensis]|nr:hypothetical protein [Cupriavidus taiwanensis]SOY44430.1 hypothetical protein CBM2585_A130017 [Cupriavidus taiwanensis]
MQISARQSCWHGCPLLQALAQPVTKLAEAKQLWQLLDYVVADYRGAVE